MQLKYQKNSPFRISDKLQNIYNEEAQHHHKGQVIRKNLYAQLINHCQHANEQKKRYQKQLQRQQNLQNDIFWKQHELKLRAEEQKRRQLIHQTRKANLSSLSQSSRVNQDDSYKKQRSFEQDLALYEAHQKKKKQQMQRLYRQGMLAQNARLQRIKIQQEIDKLIDIKKSQEKNKIQAKRQQYLKNWKQKHFQQHHPQIVRSIQLANKQKQLQRLRFHQALSVKGAHQLNQRIAAVRYQQIQQQQMKKQDHRRKLKQQVQQNLNKSAIDRYMQMNQQRKSMEQLHKYIDQRDNYEKQMKKQNNQQLLHTLRNQMKPRNLYPQPDKPEVAGIGSPAHIGKIVHDDRLRQLKWIQRNFTNQLKQI